MPSPVIGSTTFAASPANSTRPCVEPRRVERGGDRPRAVCAVGLGVRAEDAAHAAAVRATVAPLRGERFPLATLPRRDRAARRSRRSARPPPTGNTHAYPGRGPRRTAPRAGRSSTPSKYWRNACQVPSSARCVDGARGRAACAPGSSGRRRRRPTARRAPMPSSSATGTASRDLTCGRDAGRPRGPRRRRRAACVDERGVELGAGHDPGVLAVVGERQRDLPARG